MSQPIPTGPDLFGFAEDHYLKAKDTDYGSKQETYHFRAAQHYDMQALIAAVVMLAECSTDADHYDFAGWREKIGMTWLKECRGKEVRRPQCKERHTEDCAYADPPPEPKHELLPIGTRVLVSNLIYNRETQKPEHTNPEPGKIVGYDTGRTKYRWRREWNWGEGSYSEHDQWAFADNRVTVHPDGPECQHTPEPVKQMTMDAEKVQLLFQRRWACGVQTSGYHNGAECNHQDPHEGWGCGYRWTVPPINDEMAAKLGLDGSTPEPVKEEPTGPRIYVQRVNGQQGHIVGSHTAENGTYWISVYWYTPGMRVTKIPFETIRMIAPNEVDRCPNGQTRDECGSGANQCELCVAVEDAEADAIEESMNLHNSIPADCPAPHDHNRDGHLCNMTGDMQ